MDDVAREWEWRRGVGEFEFERVGFGEEGSREVAIVGIEDSG